MDRKPRIALFGNGDLAVRGVRLIRENNIDVPVVVTEPNDTGQDSWRLSLRKTALDLGYRDNDSLFSPRNPNDPDILRRIAGDKIDLILSLQCRKILRRQLTSLARIGAVNLHNAPLPLLRGCDPFSWAINDGLKNMGVTLHQVPDDGVDSGPILTQRLWPLEDFDTAWSIYQRAIEEGVSLISESIAGILDGSIRARKQDDRFASYHPMGQFAFSDLQICWSTHFTTLSAWIRARVFPPFQIPFFILKGKKTYVLKCRSNTGRGRPGEILALNPLTVAVKNGAIELMDIATKSVTSISGSEFAGEENLKCGQILS